MSLQKVEIVRHAFSTSFLHSSLRVPSKRLKTERLKDTVFRGFEFPGSKK